RVTSFRLSRVACFSRNCRSAAAFNRSQSRKQAADLSLRAPHPVPPDAGRALSRQRLGLAAPRRISIQRGGLAEPLAGGSPVSDIQREWYQAEAETSISSRRSAGGASRPSARHGSSASAVMRG